MSTAVVPAGNGGAVAVPPRRVGLLRPIAPPAEQLAAQEETRKLIAEVLHEGRDYGVIPGTSSGRDGEKERKTLYKAGAERAALAFGCYFGDPEILEKEIDHDREVRWVKRSRKYGDRTGTSYGLYRYVLRVPVIHHESGAVVAFGVGAASTMESKYVDRPRECENVVLKMAHKRAVVAGALLAFGLSDQFTQDVEDLPAAAGDDESGDEQGAPEEPAWTVELAKAHKLPGGPKAFQGQGGTPLGDLKPKALAGIVSWLEKKIDEDNEAGREPSWEKVWTVNAGNVLLEHYRQAAEKDQGKLPLDGAPAATPEPETPVSEAASGANAKPGKVQDALKPNAAPATDEDDSVTSLHKRIQALLKAEQLKPAEVEAFDARRKKKDVHMSHQALLALEAEIRALIDKRLPF